MGGDPVVDADFGDLILGVGFIFTVGMAVGGVLTESTAECDLGTFGEIKETKTSNVSITNIGNDTTLQVVESDGQNQTFEAPNGTVYNWKHEVYVEGYGCREGENQ